MKIKWYENENKNKRENCKWVLMKQYGATWSYFTFWKNSMNSSINIACNYSTTKLSQQYRKTFLFVWRRFWARETENLCANVIISIFTFLSLLLFAHSRSLVPPPSSSSSFLFTSAILQIGKLPYVTRQLAIVVINMNALYIRQKSKLNWFFAHWCMDCSIANNNK